MTSSQRYAAHEKLVASARKQPQLWRLILGLGVVIAITIWLNGMIPYALGGLLPEAALRDLGSASLAGLHPAAMLVLLASFGFMIVGTAVAALILHQRSLVDVVGGWPLTRTQFGKVAGVLAGVGGLLLILPPYNMGLELQQNLAPGRWLALLPLSLIAVGIQCAAEEILFRGYLQQQLAARFSSPWVWMVLPSALFGLGHYAPEELGDNAVLFSFWACVFGVLMADLTARAGTLGPAIAVHAANNVTALLLISLPDGMNGLALYTVPFTTGDTQQVRAWLPADFALMIVFWLGARLALRR